MNYIVRKMVEYYIQNDHLYCDLTCFKQVSVDDMLYLPLPKKNIKSIVKVISEAKIINSRIIKTPRGKSLEGIILTGHKMLIEGVITHSIQYIANSPEQPIHTSLFETPFITFLVLPENIDYCSFITPLVSIEDVMALKENDRCIFVSTKLIVSAEV